MRRAVLVAALACLTTACVVGPDYRRPPVATPSAIRGQNTPSDQSIADLPWWELFRDESLTRIIRTALANNNDLRIAVVRIEQARQGVVQARAGFLPGVGYNIAASGGQNETLGNPIAAGGRRQGPEPSFSRRSGKPTFLDASGAPMRPLSRTICAPNRRGAGSCCRSCAAWLGRTWNCSASIFAFRSPAEMSRPSSRATVSSMNA